MARFREQRGVTLAETLVALGLFAVALAGISSFLVFHVRAAGNNFRQTYAYALAEQELEALRALDYGSMASRSSTKTLGGITYTVSTSVFENNPAPNMKTVVVNVAWTDSGGPRNAQLSTIYTQVRR